MNLMIVFIPFTTAIFTFLLTHLYTLFVRRAKVFIDIPTTGKGHSFHKVPVPTSGGIPLFAGFWMGILLYIYIFQIGASLFPSFFFFSLSLLLFGILDDVIDIKALSKLLLQGLAGYVIYLMIQPQGFNLRLFTISGKISSAIFTIFLFMVTANGLNFLDGIEGLTAGYTLIVTVFTIIIYKPSFVILYILLIFCGAITGFLLINGRQGKVFLGDAGIYFLSSILILSFLLLRKDRYIDIFPFGVLMAVPMMDIGGAVSRRIRKRITPFTPDLEHIHHKLLNRIKNRLVVTIVIWCAGVFLGILAYITARYPVFTIPTLVFLLLVWTLLGLKFKWL